MKPPSVSLCGVYIPWYMLSLGYQFAGTNMGATVSSHPCLSLSCFVCSHCHRLSTRSFLINTLWCLLQAICLKSRSRLFQYRHNGNCWKKVREHLTNTSTTNTSTSTKDKTTRRCILIQKTFTSINQPTANHSPIIMQQLHPHLSPSV